MITQCVEPFSRRGNEQYWPTEVSYILHVHSLSKPKFDESDVT